MADRYWVGGSGNWTDTAKWSTTSGGAGGASVPTSGDVAIINGSSGGGTLTLNTNATITELDMVSTGFTLLSLGSNTLTVNGDVQIRGAGVNTGTGKLVFAGTHNTVLNVGSASLITGTSKRIDIIPPSGGAVVGIATGQGGASDSGVTYYIVAGGTGTVLFYGGYYPNLNFAASNYTVEVSSSDVRVEGNIVLNGPGPTFVDYSFVGIGTFGFELFTSSGSVNLSKTITCNGGSLGSIQVDNQTSSAVTYTLVDNFNGAGTFKWTAGPNYGGGAINLNINGKTLNVGGFVADTDRANIPRTITFGSGGIIKTGTFATLETQGLTFSGTPIIQIKVPPTGTTYIIAPGNYVGTSISYLNSFTDLDISIVSSGSSGGTISFYQYVTAPALPPCKIKSLTAVNDVYTLDLTAVYGGLPANQGTLEISDYITISGSNPTFANGTVIFSATSGTKNINTNNATFSNTINFNGVGGTWQLTSAFNSSGTVTLTNGTLNFNSQDVSVGTFSSSNSNARTLTFGDSTVNITGSGTAWSTATATNMTINYGAAARISMNSASAKTFAGGSKSWPTVNQGGTGTLSVTGNNTFANFTNSVNGCTIAFPSGTTTFNSFNVRGALGSLVTLSSTSTLSKASGTVAVNYLNLSNSTATGGADWYAGSGSVDGGGNTGWLFSSASTGGFLAFF